jgi:hypothetical protein
MPARAILVLDKANVVGVGFGTKVSSGVDTGEQALVVLVTRKQPLAALRAEDIVPEQVDGLVTDVLEVGEIRALDRLTAPEVATPPSARPPSATPPVSPAPPRSAPEAPPSLGRRRSRVRPLEGGISIGHYKITAGTLGAVAIDSKTRAPLLLSNNHVLANSTGPRYPAASPGDPVLQPGPYDGGTRQDTVGTLLRFVPLKIVSSVARVAKVDPAKANLVDAAVASIAPDVALSAGIDGLGEAHGTIEAKTGMNLKKSGRTTGVTSGKVRVLGSLLKVSYGWNRIGLFADQIVCTCQSQGGDSGSLIVDDANHAVGLLFAGSESVTIASPIESVIRLLAIEMPA